MGRLLFKLLMMLSSAVPVQATAQARVTAPLLRFTFDKDPDYTVVTITGSQRKDVATLNEINFPNPVIYPAPDLNNAVVAAAVAASRDDIYDTIIYFRIRRKTDRDWAVLDCEARGLYRIASEGFVSVDRIGRIARAAFVHALKQGQPIPGETCEPAQEIQKGSRTY